MEEKPQLRSLKECGDATIQAQIEKRAYYAEKRWYVVFVKPLHEFQVNDYLLNIEKEMKSVRRGKSKKEDLFVKPDPEKIRMECYVPVSREHLKYSDRMVWRERVQTPGMVFVHTALNDRDPLFHGPIADYVLGFMNDRERHRPQAIPDAQMEEFMAIVNADYAVHVSTPTFEVGQQVLIVDGPLAGRQAELVSKEETVSRKLHAKDRLGNDILDADGNPVPKHVLMLTLRLNSQLVANFEIDAEKVAPIPKDNLTKNAKTPSNES